MMAKKVEMTVPLRTASPSLPEEREETEGIVLLDPVSENGQVRFVYTAGGVPVVGVSAPKDRAKDLVFLEKGQPVRVRGRLRHTRMTVPGRCVCGGRIRLCFPDCVFVDRTRIDLERWKKQKEHW